MSQPHLEKVGCDPHTQDRQGTTLKLHPFVHVRAKIEKCHDKIEEDNTSSNTPRVWIQAKLRHMQGSRERGDTSVEDRLEKSRVAPRTITLEVRFSMSFGMRLLS